MQSDMPKVPLEDDFPNIDGEAELFWSRWLQELCWWITLSHWLVDGMGKTSGA
jgi:hypothetical protein